MPSTEHAEHTYRIAIYIAEAGHVAPLLALATPLARARGGRVMPLYVGERQEPPPWLVVPEDMRAWVDAPEALARGDASASVLSHIHEHKIDLLLAQWDGHLPAARRYLLGRALDAIVQDAPCDIALLRIQGGASDLAKQVAHVRRVLVPCGGGPNATLALDLALDMTPQAIITGVRVAPRNLGAAARSGQSELLQAALGSYAANKRVQSRLLVASDVVAGIVEEAAHDYDLVMIGATRELLVDRLVFGNVPHALAQALPQPLIIVARRRPHAAGLLRRTHWRMAALAAPLPANELVAVYRRVSRDARADTQFVVMIALSAAMASFGLLLNSGPVVIGAMVVAPMMSALVGVGMGIVQGDVWLLRSALRTALIGVLTAALVSLVISAIAPREALTSEMLGRCNPTLLDLGVALVSGMAAAYAITYKDVASALPGVSIAVALVPPLATFGLAIGMGFTREALGALLLFATNLTAIVSAVTVVFLWFGFRPNARQERAFRGGALASVALLSVVTAILALLSARSIHTASLKESIQRVLDHQVGAVTSDARLVDWQLTGMRSDAIELTVTLEGTTAASSDAVIELQQSLGQELHRSVALSVVVRPVDVITLEPYHPSSPANAQVGASD